MTANVGFWIGLCASSPGWSLLSAYHPARIASGSLYQRKCIDCHDRARDFARNRLTIDQSILKGRYQGGGRTDDVDVEVAA